MVRSYLIYLAKMVPAFPSLKTAIFCLPPINRPTNLFATFQEYGGNSMVDACRYRRGLHCPKPLLRTEVKVWRGAIPFWETPNSTRSCNCAR